MSDVLLAGVDDDVFWPPCDRTEAQAPEVASNPVAWLYAYLGSRVWSYPLGPDRVLVVQRTMPIDAWALGPSSGLYPLSVCSSLPAEWRARSTVPTLVSLTGLWVGAWVGGAGDALRIDTESPVEDPSIEWPSAVAITPTIDAAATDIKEWLGLNDSQIEAATGVSRSTIWRSRTGRTSTSRSNTEAGLWRLHAVAAALTRSLGSDGARGWLHAGDPAPTDFLLSGDLAEVERRVDAFLFHGAAVPPRFAAVQSDDYETPDQPVSSDEPLARRARRVHRAPRRSG